MLAVFGGYYFFLCIFKILTKTTFVRLLLIKLKQKYEEIFFKVFFKTHKRVFLEGQIIFLKFFSVLALKSTKMFKISVYIFRMIQYFTELIQTIGLKSIFCKALYKTYTCRTFMLGLLRIDLSIVFTVCFLMYYKL